MFNEEVQKYPRNLQGLGGESEYFDKSGRLPMETRHLMTSPCVFMSEIIITVSVNIINIQQLLMQFIINNQNQPCSLYIIYATMVTWLNCFYTIDFPIRF